MLVVLICRWWAGWGMRRQYLRTLNLSCGRKSAGPRIPRFFVAFVGWTILSFQASYFDGQDCPSYAERSHRARCAAAFDVDCADHGWRSVELFGLFARSAWGAAGGYYPAK